MARLIVNADDFGFTPGINRAVGELFRAGALSSASLMTTGPAFSDGVAIAHANPGLGIGCHLVFVDGAPVSRPETIRSLIGRDRGRFRTSVSAFLQALWRGAIHADELAREAEAQIRLLLQTGISVTHVDTHKHLHAFPAVLEAVAVAMKRTGVTGLRMPFEPAWLEQPVGISLARRWQMAAMRTQRKDFRKMTEDQGISGPMPEGTLGIAATGLLDANLLRAMLQRLRRQPEDQVYELCCHPGHVDAALLAAPTRLQATRGVEFEALLAVMPVFLREIHTGPPVSLIHYGEIGR
jgi:predicted glycoside hydrolase/deacetylase ChbG (UPF0249 family)